MGGGRYRLLFQQAYHGGTIPTGNHTLTTKREGTVLIDGVYCGVAKDALWGYLHGFERLESVVQIGLREATQRTYEQTIILCLEIFRFSATPSVEYVHLWFQALNMMLATWVPWFCSD